MSSLKIILFKGKTLQNGKHPVMLQFIADRKIKRFTIDLYAGINEWNFDLNQFNSNVKNYKNKNLLLQKILDDAERLLSELKLKNHKVSREIFYEHYKKTRKTYSLFELINELSEYYKGRNMFHGVEKCNSLLNKFKDYQNNRDISAHSITPRYLEQFEEHEIKKGLSPNSIIETFARLKVVFNHSISKGLLPIESYPFRTQMNRNGFALSVKKQKTRARALSEEDLDKLKEFHIEEYPNLKETYNLFFLSYYARGINIKDIFCLRHSDIYDGRIYYRRIKTGELLDVKISEPIEKILNDFKNSYPNSKYLIPMNYQETPKSELFYSKYKKRLQKINMQLKTIGKLANLDTELTSYMARHSYATRLKRKGISVDLISEALGHSDTKVTKHYLSKFDNSILDAADNLL